MNKEVEVRFWRKMDNSEVMGIEVAYKARQIADFIESLELVSYDTYSTNNFSVYVESLVRGYQINNQEYEELNVTTTLDLHNITVQSLTLSYFLSELKNNWWKNGYVDFARENGLI